MPASCLFEDAFLTLRPRHPAPLTKIGFEKCGGLSGQQSRGLHASLHAYTQDAAILRPGLPLNHTVHRDRVRQQHPSHTYRQHKQPYLAAAHGVRSTASWGVALCRQRL